LREVPAVVVLRSTDDTQRAAAARPPHRRAFDFDGTLTGRRECVPLLVSVRGALPVVRAVLRLSPPSCGRRSPAPAADEVKGGFSCAFSGPGLTSRSSLGPFAHRHLQRHLRADARRRLECTTQGHYTVIVSARRSATSAGGEELGVDGCGDTPRRRRRGLLTGGTKGRTARRGEVPRLVGHLARVPALHNGGEQPCCGLRQQPR